MLATAAIALHELGHVVAMNAHARVDTAWIRRDADGFCVGTDDVTGRELHASRASALWNLSGGLVVDWCHRWRNEADPATMCGALAWGALGMFLGRPHGATDARQILALLGDDRGGYARLVHRLANIELPLAREADPAALDALTDSLNALAVGERLEFDTGRELMDLAGITRRRKH